MPRAKPKSRTAAAAAAQALQEADDDPDFDLADVSNSLPASSSSLGTRSSNRGKASGKGGGGKGGSGKGAKRKGGGGKKGAAQAELKQPRVNRAHCDFCDVNLTHVPCFVRCADCKDFDLCLNCFSVGVEIDAHRNWHPYYVMEQLSDFPVFPDQAPDWSAAEELYLLEGIDMYGFGNWDTISKHVELKSPVQCRDHAEMIFLDGSENRPLPILPPEDQAITREDVLEMRRFPNRLAQYDAARAKQLAAARDGAPAVKSEDEEMADATGGDASTADDGNTGGGADSVGASAGALRLAPGEIAVEGADVALVEDDGQAPIPESADLLPSLDYDMRVEMLDMAPTLLRPDARSEALVAPTGRQYEGQAQSTSMSNHDWAGWMRLRGDFAEEWENNAEKDLTDINFKDFAEESSDAAQMKERELKLRMLENYNQKLNERAYRKRMIVENNLFEYRKFERRRMQDGTHDLYDTTKVFLRLLGIDRYERFLAGLREEKMLRERVMHLRELRALGITTLAEAEAHDRSNKPAGEEGAAQAKLSWNTGREAVTASARRERSAWRAAAATAAESDAQLSLSRSSSRLDLQELEASAGGLGASGARNGHAAPPLDISRAAGVGLLSPDERELCTKLRLWPLQYVTLKDSLIRASLDAGRLDTALASDLAKCDNETLVLLFDFFLAKGWINRDYASVGDGESSAMPPIVP